MISPQWNWPGRIFLGVIVVNTATAFLSLFKTRESGGPVPCQSNLKQISLGVLQYCDDYDGKMPITAAGGGWAEALQPYLKSTQLFRCVSARPGATGTTYTDYFYNARNQGRVIKIIEEPWRVIMLGDGNDGRDATNASYALTSIAEAWRTDSSSPAFRHENRANYAFVDGHVKAVRVEQITTMRDGDKYYFQPRNALK
jgi:prepilin-type processing-associated H-X9-DG protein